MKSKLSSLNFRRLSIALGIVLFANSFVGAQITITGVVYSGGGAVAFNPGDITLYDNCTPGGGDFYDITLTYGGGGGTPASWTFNSASPADCPDPAPPFLARGATAIAIPSTIVLAATTITIRATVDPANQGHFCLLVQTNLGAPGIIEFFVNPGTAPSGGACLSGTISSVTQPSTICVAASPATSTENITATPGPATTIANYKWELLPVAPTVTLPAGLVLTKGASSGQTLSSIPADAGGSSTVAVGWTSALPAGEFNYKIKVSDVANAAISKETAPVNVKFDPSCSPIGPWNTLVLYVADNNTSTLDPTKVNDAIVFMNEVSHNNTGIVPKIETTSKKFAKSQITDYNNTSTGTTPLKDLAVEFLCSLSATDREQVKHLVLLVKGGTAASGKDYFFSTLGNRSYDCSGTPKDVTVTIADDQLNFKIVAHCLLNNLGLSKLHFFPYAGDLAIDLPSNLPSNLSPVGWDIMALSGSTTITATSTFPNVWSKTKPPTPFWVSSSGNIDYRQYNPGAAGTGKTATLKIQSLVDPAGTDKAACVIGLTPGTGTLSAEKQFIWMEARENRATNQDDVLEDGVLIYFVNTDQMEGAAPVRLIDAVPATASRMAFTPGVYNISIPSSGVTIKNVAKSGDTYTVTYDYAPPSNNSDLQIPYTAGAYTTPNVWVVRPGKSVSSEETAHNTKFNRGGTNMIFARIVNLGPTNMPAGAHVSFYLSSLPNPSPDGFSYLGTVEAPAISSGSTAAVSVSVAIPTGTACSGACCNPNHACIRAVIDYAPYDPNLANNSAQQNANIYSNCSSSPYPPINYPFQVNNPDTATRLIILDVENMPEGWKHSFVPAFAVLAGKQTVSATLHVEVPDNQPKCTNQPIKVVAWTPEDHTLVKLGGFQVDVEQRRAVQMTLETATRPCERQSSNNSSKNTETKKAGNVVLQPKPTTYDSVGYAKLLGYILSNKPSKPDRGCMTIFANGCTNPKLPNQKVLVRYTDPSGNPIFKEVMTDANGCYHDSYLVTEGGEWGVTGIFEGDFCNGPSDVTNVVTVGIPVTLDTDGDKLPDNQEIGGFDSDGDGIPNPLDSDSDNDGIIDGNEPTGDSDCDGLANSVDADSDNDGKPDGQDPTPYGKTPLHKLFFSAMYHRFDFDSDLPISDGNGFNLRAGVNLHAKWGLELEVGYTSSDDSTKNSGKVYNINLNGLYYLNAKTVTPYLTAGLGGLFFNALNSTASTFAVNGGVGIMANTTPMAGLALRAEIKAHYGFGGYNTSGNLNIQYSIGFVYRTKTKSTPCNLKRGRGLFRRP